MARSSSLSAPKRRGACRPMRRAAALVAVLAAGSAPTASGVYPDTGACAQCVVKSVKQVTGAVYMILSAAADCTLQGLSEISCASDITNMLSNWFNLGSTISLATLACGSLDNMCSSTILVSLGDMSDTSANLIAAATDCVTDPFLCTYDTVSAVATMNDFITDILLSLQFCNDLSSVPNALALRLWFANGAITSGFIRRLKESDDVTPESAELDMEPQADKEPVQAISPADLDELARELKESMAQLKELAERLKKQQEERLQWANSTASQDRLPKLELTIPSVEAAALPESTPPLVV